MFLRELLFPRAITAKLFPNITPQRQFSFASHTAPMRRRRTTIAPSQAAKSKQYRRHRPRPIGGSHSLIGGERLEHRLTLSATTLGASPQATASTNTVEQITQAQANQMLAMVASGNRTGAYIYYYELTGSQQAITQAEISSFSGILGGTALNANLLIQANDALFGANLYPKDVETFSVTIATDFFNHVATDVDQGGTGVFSDPQMLAFAQDSWTNVGLPGQFPGHISEAWDALTQGDAGGVASNFFTSGTGYAIEGLWLEITAGITDPSPNGSFTDYLFGNYTAHTTSDGNWQYIVDNTTGNTVYVGSAGSLLNQAFPTLQSYAQLLNNIAAVFPDLHFLKI